MQKYSEGEIHFSLMAVISELRRKYERELERVLNGKRCHLSILVHDEIS